MWELQTGKELFQFRQQEPCRAVSLSVGEGMLAFTTDAFMGTQSMIHIAKLEQDIEKQSSKSVLSIEAPKGRITRVFWSELNRVLVTSHDGGFLRKWDSEVGSDTARAFYLLMPTTQISYNIHMPLNFSFLYYAIKDWKDAA